MEDKEFADLQLQFCNTLYNQNTVEGWAKSCILPFSKKGDLRILKKSWIMTLTSIAAKVYNILLLNCIANAPTQTESQLLNLEQAARGFGFQVNVNKTKYMCFNQERANSTLNGNSLKSVDKFTYLCSCISFSESDVSWCLAKTWTTIDRPSIIWKFDLSDKLKPDFFLAVFVLILRYGCTTWMLTRCIEKKLDGNCTRMLWAILNKSWKKHPTKQQMYGHLPPISKTIKVSQTRHVKHCWRNKDELISDILLWPPSHGRASVSWLIGTYLQSLCTDTRCILEDLLEVMGNTDGKRERVREIHASSAMMMMTVCLLCRSQSENIIFEFVFAFPAVSSISCLSYLNGFWNGK